MDDAGIRCGRKCAGDGVAHVQRSLHGQPAALRELAAEIARVHELHHHVRRRLGATAVDLDHVRVATQCVCSEQLHVGAQLLGGPRGERAGESLKGHYMAVPSVDGSPDLSQPAGANMLLEPVRPKELAAVKRHWAIRLGTYSFEDLLQGVRA